MKSRLSAAFALFALTLSACGGGGGGGGGNPPVTPPTVQPSGVPGTPAPPVTTPTPTPTPVGATPSPTPIGATPTPKPTATPKPTPTPIGATPSPTPTATPVHTATPPPATPTPVPTPVRTATPVPTQAPTSTPTPIATLYPADPPSAIRSTYGRIALNQIFDYFPSDNTQMSPSQVSADASRYDWVWGSFNGSPAGAPADTPAWRNANPQALVSRYYIIEEDNTLVSGRNLQWWQQNHPDWILYACDSSGNPTHDIAYTPGDGFPDVPLNIHNPSVVQYQINQSLIPFAQANGYNALALDEVIFHDIMEGGNPKLGQTVKSGEYGCGVWNNDGSFTKVYQNTSDPAWTADVLNWVATAKQAAALANIKIVVNHPAGSISDSNEQALMRNVDVTLDEAGFTDYGNYGSVGFFTSTYNYVEWVEKQGVAIGLVQKYYHETTSFTPSEIEYAIATYMMANEGNSDMFLVGNNGPGYGYGAEQYHGEYATQLGAPCAAMQGGTSGVYYRRFQNGLVIANVSGSATSASLPNHSYRDIEGRTVTNPLSINAHDAYVMTTTGGCQ